MKYLFQLLLFFPLAMLGASAPSLVKHFPGNSTYLGRASAIEVAGNYAYIASAHQHGSNHYGVAIVDISDPANPQIVAGYGENDSRSLNLPRALKVVGNTLYVSSNEGVEIIDISDPTNPSQLAAFVSSGSVWSLTIEGNYLYGTLAYGSNDGLLVLDISNPTSPTQVAMLQDNSLLAMDNAQGIAVEGTLAYVVSSDGFQIADVSNPLSPSALGKILDSATTYQDVAVSGQYAFAAAIQGGIKIIDVSNPATPSISTTITDIAGVPLYARELHLNGNLLYAFSSHFNPNYDKIDIFDITDPLNPIHQGSLSDDNHIALQEVYDLDVVGNHLYASSYFDNGLCIIDISTPSNPSAIASYYDDQDTDLYYASRILTDGNITYVGSYHDGRTAFSILDTTDPLNPLTLSKTYEQDLPGEPLTMTLLAKSGDYLYLNSTYPGSVYTIDVINVSDPAAPTYVTSVNESGTMKLRWVKDMEIVGDVAYLTCSYNGIFQVLDLSDPTNPSEGNQIVDAADKALSYCNAIEIQGNYAYVPAYNDFGIAVIDITDPANPSYHATVQGGGFPPDLLRAPYDLIIDGQFAYVACMDANTVDYVGFSVVDISDPANPTAMALLEDTADRALGHPNNLVRVGDYIYISSSIGDNGVEVIDVSDPLNPTHKTALFDDDNSCLWDARDIVRVGNYLYVASGDGLQIVEPISSFSSWSTNHFSPSEIGAGLADATSDADGDGYSNEYEYFYGLDPRDPGSSNAISNTVTDDGGQSYFTFTMTRRKDAQPRLNYRYLVSDNLTSWDAKAEGSELIHTPGSPVDNGDGTETVTLRYHQDVTNTPRFFLKTCVEQP